MPSLLYEQFVFKGEMFQFYVFASFTVLWLCNMNQRNAQFSHEYFN